MAHWMTAGLLAVLCLGAAGCAAQAPPYRNVANPAWGKAEFDKDTEQCRRENSVATNFVGAYSEISGRKVDEEKAQACMAAHGWRPASDLAY